ncbi:uncharacterized protein LOC111034217 [Myzus persicae]|uniref:uncharacterized protein LOC111034217 n=1 Tax=Myzus persicae TaxID=13164 RepID=UPI000B937E87|nr:uncharacterized protein LOC111034217 [Myzus persicae]XP_022171134.1 uncharacterized protein LOC111034217 [Myzus persicae]XP_022171216.1 uncharacterized protein LOC111034217 [Myzus persicae]XP_022171293.1 uncharacterized protein LOC111034217 [Myzus persicae]
MKHDDKFNSPAGGAKNQQVEKKLNAFTPTKKNNDEIMMSDLDTQFSIIEKLRNSPKDSKRIKGNGRSFPSSFDGRKHSLNKSGESSNIKDTNARTAKTERDDKANARKIAAFVRKVLHNELPKEKVEWPLCLLIESKQSIKISQQEFRNMIIDKSAEVMATKSRYAKQMVNISVCKEHQRSYYEKYKQLLNDINTMNTELNLMNRMPSNAVKHVRNVGTNINTPVNYYHAKNYWRVQHRY